ncbi:MAG: twin-arginine translocase TatA/TatE family subunit [Acidobacteria bacterium]|nr:twin-arginine translocase TatA/TatE family subunit [Acidobacteriota bacterium]
MFGSLGFSEILIIFLVALIIFGPRKLPELGKSLGRGLAEFKKASNDLKRTWEEEVRAEDEKIRELTDTSATSATLPPLDRDGHSVN